MTGRKERFKPSTPGKVSMFVCGPTVQSLIHLGHARTNVFYDVVARYLAHLGYRVNYLMNITDFDERITQAAAGAHETPTALAQRYTDAFLEDMAALKCTSVSRFEPVSKHVKTMIEQVKSLVDSGKGYEVDGWVYFDTTKFRRFGQLSHQTRLQLDLHPMELSPRKRHLPDFGLWRPEILLEGRWHSPWGLGSPGWHIQDTAVTLTVLGPQYDIHGGAYELVYPHHEAEIAQCESLTGIHPVVKYWVHTHHVNMKGRKMSKSLGNIVTVRDALKDYSPDELRFFLLGSHYRRDMDLRGMDASVNRFRKMRNLAKEMAKESGRRARGTVLPSFKVAMDDDFDTPAAINSVQRTLERVARTRNGTEKSEVLASALTSMKTLGVDLLGDT
jgi:cysteinyl-tRNA synthetase